MHQFPVETTNVPSLLSRLRRKAQRSMCAVRFFLGVGSLALLLASPLPGYSQTPYRLVATQFCAINDTGVPSHIVRATFNGMINGSLANAYFSFALMSNVGNGCSSVSFPAVTDALGVVKNMTVATQVKILGTVTPNDPPQNTCTYQSGNGYLEGKDCHADTVQFGKGYFFISIAEPTPATH